MTEFTDITLPEIERDRWSRPMVISPKTKKKVAYTRCTTFVGALEDTYSLGLWQQRMVARGLASRPDLLLAVTGTDPDDKRKLDGITKQACEAAAASSAATIGTALHSLTEMHDRGQDLPVIPGDYQADVQAYIDATKDLQVTHVEQFLVHDELKIGGTADRIVEYGGDTYIADIKTGQIEFGIGKIAMQLAVYARSALYDVPAALRGDYGHPSTLRSSHGASHDHAVIIHLPAGTGTCELVWIDIAKAWDAVQHAGWVRDWRKLKRPDFTTGDPAGTLPHSTDDVLSVAINVATTEQELLDLWRDHRSEWTQIHTANAAARKKKLALAS